MTFELTLLAWSVVLLFVHIGLQASFLTRDLGSDDNAGPRDEPKTLSARGGRADRALRNFLETFPAFIALALITAVAGQSDWLTQWGAGIYLVARVVYIPLYLFGVTYMRSLAFTIGAVGLLMMLVGILI